MAVTFLVGMLLVSAVSMLLSAYATQRILTPISSLPLSFLLASLAYFLPFDQLYPLTARGVLGLLLAAVTYVIGSLITLVAFRRMNTWSLKGYGLLGSSRGLFRVITFLFVVAVVATVVHVRHLMSIAGTNDLWVVYTRSFYIVDLYFLMHRWSLLWQLNMLVLPLSLVYIIHFRTHRTFLSVTAGASLLSLALKGDLFYVVFPLLTTIMAILFVIAPKEEKRVIIPGLLLSALIVVALFVFTYSLYFHNYTEGFKKAQVYAAGSLVAFGQLASREPVDLRLGAVFSKQFLAVSRLNVDLEEPTYAIGPSTTTNVVSLLGVFYEDFGWLGLLVLPALAGILGTSLLAWQMQTRSLTSLIALSTFMTASLLAFFGNFFGFVIEYFLVGVLLLFEFMAMVVSGTRDAM